MCLPTWAMLQVLVARNEARKQRHLQQAAEVKRRERAEQAARTEAAQQQARRSAAEAAAEREFQQHQQQQRQMIREAQVMVNVDFAMSTMLGKVA